MKPSLDLHGVKHADVQREIDVFLYQQMQAQSTNVTIITGNSVKMKTLVQSVLAEYGMVGEDGFWNKGELPVCLI